MDKDNLEGEMNLDKNIDNGQREASTPRFFSHIFNFVFPFLLLFQFLAHCFMQLLLSLVRNQRYIEGFTSESPTPSFSSS